MAFSQTNQFRFLQESLKGQAFLARNHTNLRDNLINDLRHICYNIRGEYKLSPAVVSLFEAYYKSCVIELEERGYGHVQYLSAWVHCLKLSMALQSAKGRQHGDR